MCFPTNIVFIVNIFVVVNFLSHAIFHFSFVFGYGNVANEVETKEKYKLRVPEVKKLTTT